MVPSNHEEQFDVHSGKAGVNFAIAGYSVPLCIRYREASIMKNDGGAKNSTEFFGENYIHRLIETPWHNKKDSDDSCDDRFT